MIGDIGEAKESWTSFHLYYHEDLNRAVMGFAYPAILTLLRSSWIDGFFFVRYGLGGPHLRLRLRTVSEREELVATVVQSKAEQFLEEAPSTAPVEEATIRRSNAAILAGDLHETDDSVYPDNTFLAVTFSPETHRYGGPELLPASLDFFTLSSALALDILRRSGREPRARQLMLFLQLLLRQALSFAADEEDLLALAGYGVKTWGEALPTILAKGDKVFARQRESFCGLFLREFRSLSSPDLAADLPGLLGEGAGRLSEIIGTADWPKRRSIGISQLHMTATRLGLSNIEEVYIGRLLQNTSRELLGREPEIVAFLTRPREPQGETLYDLLPRAFALLQESAP